MSGLKELRNRIESIKSTRKITKAMQLVAASKLRPSKNQLDNSIDSFHFISDLMNHMILNIVPDLSYLHNDIKKLFNFSSLIGLDREIKKEKKENVNHYLFIVFSSGRGLCGSFNSDVIKALKNRIDQIQNDSKGEKNPEIKIIAVGKKILSLMGDYKKYIDFTLDIKLEYVNEITKIISNYINQYIKATKGEFVCDLYFNKFKNLLVQEKSVLNLFPINLSNNLSNLNNVDNGDSVSNLRDQGFAESFVENFSHLIDLYIMRNISFAMNNNIVGEEAARMRAMDNASKNANELIDELTLILNRSRQAIITTELTEIISSANAVTE